MKNVQLAIYPVRNKAMSGTWDYHLEHQLYSTQKLKKYYNNLRIPYNIIRSIEIHLSNQYVKKKYG